MKKLCIFTVLFAFLISACSKKENTNSLALEQDALTEKHHKWYYFAGDDFLPIDSISNVPFQNEKPWTEAVRISSISSALGNGRTYPNAYAIVNRLGLIVFSEMQIKLHKDENIFLDRTADNLFFQNDIPFFSLYKSSFFNTSLSSTSAKENMHLFLVQFDPSQNVFYPVINCANLGLNAISEVTDFIWDGSSFLCSIKTDDAEKTAFSYLSIKPKVSLTNITPVNASSNTLISSADESSFRSQIIPENLEYAPERLKATLSLLNWTTPFSVACYTQGGVSPRNYITTNDEEVSLHAVAKIADTYVCALFQDGTAYFTGALFGRHIFQDKKVKTFLLPTLPKGFIYSDFSITGAMLYAAWEESTFYKTGRSGFISVNLDSILYETSQGTVK